MKIEKPPYTIAPEILFRIEEIGEAIGRATGIVQDLRLRRINRIPARPLGAYRNSWPTCWHGWAAPMSTR